MIFFLLEVEIFLTYRNIKSPSYGHLPLEEKVTAHYVFRIVVLFQLRLHRFQMHFMLINYENFNMWHSWKEYLKKWGLRIKTIYICIRTHGQESAIIRYHTYLCLARRVCSSLLQILHKVIWGAMYLFYVFTLVWCVL